LFHLKLLDISKRSGGDGSGDRSTGADGEDKFIEVPLGTVVRERDWRSFVRNYRRWRKQVLSGGRFRKLAL
jgi:GTP-binding protein